MNTFPNIFKNEDTPEAHLILGILYEEVKRYDEAVFQYDMSFSLRSSFTSALCRSYLVRKFVKLCCPKVDYDLDWLQPILLNCHIMFVIWPKYWFIAPNTGESGIYYRLLSLNFNLFSIVFYIILIASYIIISMHFYNNSWLWCFGCVLFSMSELLW